MCISINEHLLFDYINCKKLVIGFIALISQGTKSITVGRMRNNKIVILEWYGTVLYEIMFE